MDPKKTLYLDLKDYGMTGTAEIQYPSLRRKNMMKNALGNCTRSHMVDGKPVIDETFIADADVVHTLAYVKKAPFPTDLSGFYDYCDEMDEKDLGSAERMYTRLKELQKEIDSESPFADSP